MMHSHNKATFFTKAIRTKRITDSDEIRRNIILSMLELGKPFSTRKIASNADVSYGACYKHIETFVKSDIVKRVQIAKHNHRQDFAYELTLNGLVIAMAVKYVSKKLLAIDEVLILQKIFQTKPKDDAITTLINYVMLNAIDRKQIDYVMNYLHTAVTELEKSGGVTDWKKVALGLVRTKEDQKILIKCINSALTNLSETDKITVNQYYKNQIEGMLFQISIRSRNRKLQEIIVESQRDPENIILPFNHKCGYSNNHFSFYIPDLIIHAFTGKHLKCPKCKLVLRIKETDWSTYLKTPQKHQIMS